MIGSSSNDIALTVAVDTWDMYRFMFDQWHTTVYPHDHCLSLGVGGQHESNSSSWLLETGPREDWTQSLCDWPQIVTVLRDRSGEVEGGCLGGPTSVQKLW